MKGFVLAKNSLAPSRPRPRDFDLPISRLSALHGFAARPHYREERFDAMDAIPEQVRMVRLQLARTVSLRVGDLADRAMLDCLCVLAKPQSGCAKHWHPSRMGQSKNLFHILCRPRHWLVDEHRFRTASTQSPGQHPIG